MIDIFILILFGIKVKQLIYLKARLLYNYRMERNVNTESGMGCVTGGIVFSAAVVAYICLNIIFSLICSATNFTAESDAYIYISYLLAPAAVAISVPIVLKRRRVSFKVVLPLKLSTAKNAVKWCGAAVLLAFGLLFSLSWLNLGFERLLNLFGYESTASYFPDLSGGRVALALLVMVVIPAVFEEVLFRGALLQNIREEAGEFNSIFLCGMCFALFHASPVQTIYQFVCGCVFALLALRARSLIPCMLAHFLNNAAIIVLQACGLDTAGTIFDWAPLWAAVLITVLSALSFLGGMAILILDRAPLNKPVKGGVKYFFLAACVGILALAALWIAGLF